MLFDSNCSPWRLLPNELSYPFESRIREWLLPVDTCLT
jgi:hypothetical protein